MDDLFGIITVLLIGAIIVTAIAVETNQVVTEKALTNACQVSSFRETSQTKEALFCKDSMGNWVELKRATHK